MVLSKATRAQDSLDSEQEKEEKRLRKLSNIVLVDYIKNMCELLYNELASRAEKDPNEAGAAVQKGNSAIPLEYEEHIQSLEAQVRGHYSIQNQLKLHIEITEGENELALKEVNEKLNQQQFLLAETQDQLQKVELSFSVKSQDYLQLNQKYQ
jgi:hypothetical protein